MITKEIELQEAIDYNHKIHVKTTYKMFGITIYIITTKFNN